MVQAAEIKKLIDLDFKNADIKDILRALATQAGVTFIIDQDVTATVTLHLTGKTFTEALNFLCKTYNLAFTKEENVYHISQIDTSFLKVEYENGKLSVEARGAKLITLFNLITQKTGQNYILDPLILDRGSILLAPVPLDDGITVLLRQFNLLGTKKASITYITRNDGGVSSNTRVEYQNGLLTVDAKNIPLQTLTRLITEKTGVSIVPDNNLNLNVTILVGPNPIGDALAALCDTNNLGLSKENSIFRIYKLNNSFRVTFINNALSVDAEGADAEALFQEISRKSGVTINLDRDLRAQISIHIKSVTLFQGITSIADSVGWIIEKRGTAYQLHYNNQQTPNIKIFYNPESKLFDIDVQSASLSQVINEIARKADLNIAVSNQVNWPVTVRLIGVTVYQAFEYLLKGTIYSYKEEDTVFIFSDTMYPRPETADFVEMKIYPLKYLKADQVLNTLPSIFPRQDFMLLMEKNALIVTGPPNIHVMFTDYLNQIDIERIEDRTEVLKIKHLKAEDVLKYLPASIPKQDIVVIKEMNAITVTGPQNLVNQIKQYIEKIDQPNPMIVFNIKVIKITNSNSLDWKAPTIDGIPLNINKSEPNGLLPLTITGSLSITALDVLVSKGKATVMQNPIITTLNGYPTSFSVSSDRYYLINNATSSSGTVGSGTPTPTPDPGSLQPKPFSNSLTITITPWVAANNQITMEIKPRIKEYGAVSGSGYPDTSEHTTETTVRVNNKQPVLISGLRTTRKEKSVTKIPILGDIPLLGFLFRKTKNVDVQDEFVIMITPTLAFDDFSQADANQTIENILPALNGLMPHAPTPTATPTLAPSATTAPSSTPVPSAMATPSPTTRPFLPAVTTVTPTPAARVTPTPTRARSLTSSGITPGSKNFSLQLAERLFMRFRTITVYLASHSQAF